MRELDRQGGMELLEQREDRLLDVADLPGVVPLVDFDQSGVEQAIPDGFAFQLRCFQRLLKSW